MKCHILQHVPFEGPAGIVHWSERHGHALSITRFWRDEVLPEPHQIDALLVLGGPMNIYEHERYPWLSREKRFIEGIVAAGKPVAGICLGAQLLADILGARVFRNPQAEIGWFPVSLTPSGQRFWPELPNPMMAFHWHGDTFELPAGAMHLARSQGCVHQAYLYGDRVLGLQFHLESTPESVKELITHGQGDLLQSGPFVQTEGRLLAQPEHFEALHTYLDIALSSILSKPVAPEASLS